MINNYDDMTIIIASNKSTELTQLCNKSINQSTNKLSCSTNNKSKSLNLLSLSLFGRQIKQIHLHYNGSTRLERKNRRRRKKRRPEAQQTNNNFSFFSPLFSLLCCCLFVWEIIITTTHHQFIHHLSLSWWRL